MLLARDTSAPCARCRTRSLRATDTGRATGTRGRHPAGHGRGDGQLDPRAPACVLHRLLDHGHPLAAHADRGQHGVRALLGRGPLGDADHRLLATGRPSTRHPARAGPADGPAGTAGTTPRSPRAAATARTRSPGRPGAQPFHGVIERPAKGRLPDNVPAVAGHAPGHIRPAGDDREQLAALDDGDPVTFFEPQRAQRPRVQRWAPAGCLVCAMGINGAWPAFSRDRSELCGACSSCDPRRARAPRRRCASTRRWSRRRTRPRSLRLPYGLSLSSTAIRDVVRYTHTRAARSPCP